MLAKGARLDLHSENGQGPRPIHWASRNGHVAVVDILLSVSMGNSDVQNSFQITMQEKFSYYDIWIFYQTFNFDYIVGRSPS